MERFDIALIGGGIVGVSTALSLKTACPDLDVVLIEKENTWARHQTGHNSGVIHAGVYYQPGSLKARFCKQGLVDTLAFCREHRIPFRQCGKLLVATSALEMERMQALAQRCKANGIHTEPVSRKQLKQLEPHISGLGAFHVPATGITDFIKITSKKAAVFKAMGGRVYTGRAVTRIEEEKSQVCIHIGQEQVRARFLVACAGLMADRLARMMDIDLDFSIIPFRGEYYALPARLSRMVSHLVYPIPDPDLPFLGVHLTPMIDGRITVGPNAVLGFKREGYGRVNLDLKDMSRMAFFPGFWKVLAQNMTSGIGELKDSFHKTGYLKRIQKYCPSLTLSDLHAYPAGIRAQAVKKDGSLVHDFLFAETPRSLHVCNAPSPAATSAGPIGAHLCGRAKEKFNL